MDEFSFINRIKQKTYKQSTVIKGIGDDAAVFRQLTEDIVTAVDTFVEGIHFTRKTMRPFYIGYRALAANISDLAAMGALPAFYLVSIVIPKYLTDEELLEIFSGMRKIAATYKLDLIGGDTVSGKELVISITIIGYVEKGKARYRDVARDGDIVFVTGTLGDSQAGLHMLTNKGDFINKGYFINKHWMPSPRVDFARGLKSLSRVALNDISDGIANEASEIAEASLVNITLYGDKIPISPSYNQFSPTLQFTWKYFGGEDFELVGTVQEKDWDFVKETAEKEKTCVTKIGYVEYNGVNHGQVFLQENNQKTLLQKHGYTHLK